MWSSPAERPRRTGEQVERRADHDRLALVAAGPERAEVVADGSTSGRRTSGPRPRRTSGCGARGRPSRPAGAGGPPRRRPGGRAGRTGGSPGPWRTRTTTRLERAGVVESRGRPSACRAARTAARPEQRLVRRPGPDLPGHDAGDDVGRSRRVVEHRARRVDHRPGRGVGGHVGLPLAEQHLDHVGHGVDLVDLVEVEPVPHGQQVVQRDGRPGVGRVLPAGDRPPVRPGRAAPRRRACRRPRGGSTWPSTTTSAGWRRSRARTGGPSAPARRRSARRAAGRPGPRPPRRWFRSGRCRRRGHPAAGRVPGAPRPGATRRSATAPRPAGEGAGPAPRSRTSPIGGHARPWEVSRAGPRSCRWWCPAGGPRAQRWRRRCTSAGPRPGCRARTS